MEFYSQGDPRAKRIPRPEDLKHVDHNRILEIYEERFSDVDDFIFVFTGNFDEEELISKLERYIACIPSLEGSETWIDHHVRPPQGKKKLEVYKGKDDKSMTILDYWKEIKVTEERVLMLNALGKYLNIRLKDILREEMGGVYTIRANANAFHLPFDRAFIKVQIPSAPDNVDKLVGAVVDILKDVSENGVSSENIDKVKEIMKRENELRLKQNKPWVQRMMNCVRWKQDFASITDFDKFETITGEGIQKIFNECFDPEVYLQATLYPESMKP